MASIEPEHFPPDASRSRRLLFAAACCLAVFAAFVLKERVPIDAYAIAIMMTLCGLYLLRRWWRTRSGAVMTDDEGIWPARKSREDAFVRWTDIRSTGWTWLPGGLHLRGGDGKKLMTIPIDLRDFGRLERIIAERARDESANPVHAVPNACSATFPIGLWPLLAAFGLLVVLLPSAEWLWGGVTFVDIMIWIFLIVVLLYPSSNNLIPWVWRVSFENGLFRVWYPLHALEIAREEIESVTVGKRHDDIWQLPVVLVRLKWGKQPVAIRGLRHSPEEMLLRIESWLADGSPGTEASGQTAPTPAAR